MDTPIITSLVVADALPNPDGRKQTPSWHAPFLELLGLLKIIDNSKPAPAVDEHRFCFQPSHDLSEISRVFLSVSTSDLRYDIDLDVIRAVGSIATPAAVTELQEYANKVLRRNQQFRDRLLQHELINDPRCFSHVDMFTCPHCLWPLIGCLECDARVTCSNMACLGSHVTDCEQCYVHKRVVCYECLKQNDASAPLIYCTTCQTWRCREDTYWCPGLVTRPTLGSEELAQLSRECDWDNETIVRSHPPKPSACKSCVDNGLPWGWAICYNSETDIITDRCPSQTPFMTDNGLVGAHCVDCLESSPGHRCACGLAWLCDTCFAIGNKSAEFPYILTCPRCGVDYCTGPSPYCTHAIDHCRSCRGVILCNNCHEEEDLAGDIPANPELLNLADFTQRCNMCRTWSCSDCAASERAARCFHCQEWYCHICVADSECDVIHTCLFCGGAVCRQCRRDNRGCMGPVMPWPMMPPYPSNF